MLLFSAAKLGQGDTNNIHNHLCVQKVWVSQ